MTEGMSEGGFDFGAMLEQAQQVQQNLLAAQRELAETEITSSSGHATVAVTGTGELTRVEIKPGVVNGDDAGDMTDLGDLIVAAYRDAKSQADELAKATLGPLTGGLELPGVSGPAAGDPEGSGSGGQVGFGV